MGDQNAKVGGRQHRLWGAERKWTRIVRVEPDGRPCHHRNSIPPTDFQTVTEVSADGRISNQIDPLDQWSM